ncbi:MAG: hypothetical protein ACFE8J_04520 [Candidatus Heimdallarchaeota archaeon]
MNRKNWKEWAYIFIMIGPLQYIIFTGIAMIFYTGGILTNPNTTGYSFWQNFFSDLGRTVALSGRSNIISFSIFTISALILVFSLAFYIIAMQFFFKNNHFLYKLSRINTILGLIAGFFMFCVVLTPWNLFPTIHIIFSRLFSLTSLFVLIIFSFIIIKNEDYPNLYSYVYLIIIFFALIYTLITVFGPSMVTSEGLFLQATAQKFSQYSWLNCFIFQGYGSIKLLK